MLLLTPRQNLFKMFSPYRQEDYLMKKLVSALLLLLFAGLSLSAQTILTAGAYFQQISEYYATIKEYEAEINITAEKSNMSGHVSFKKPNYLRIDFTNPENQVIAYNGDSITIYLPGPDAILEQSLTEADASASGANLATPQGLYLLSRYYYISYESGQKAVPLDEGSDEKVVVFLLSRKNATEGFKTIRICVNENSKLIRRVEAVTATGQTFNFDFYGYALNTNIPDARFIYAPPSSANSYNNFLFSE